MPIKKFTCGPFETNCYLDGTVLFDAPPGSYEVIDYPVSHILLTHSHWDHTADCAKFKKFNPDLVIVCHEADKGNVEAPGSDGLPLFMRVEGIKVDRFVKEGDIVEGFQVIELPGHTPGGVGYYDAKRGLLISGDTLFRGTIGNLSFPTARPQFMWKSLKKLAKLPPETVVLPGHGPSTTIGKEKWIENAEDYMR